MSKWRDFIVGKHSPLMAEIPKKLYDQKESELSEDEFKKKYKYIDYQGYYELIDYDPEDSSLTELLLHKILEEQVLINKRLGIITGVMVVSFMLGVVSALGLL